MRNMKPWMVGIFAVAFAAGVTAGDAAQYRGGANHPGTSPDEEAADLSGLGVLDLCLDFAPLGDLLADPLVIEDMIVIASLDGRVGVYEAETGTVVWTRTLDAGISATPAYDSGRLFVGTQGGTLYALKFTDGAILWQEDHGGYQIGAPVVSANSVVVAPGFGNSNLLVYDADDGDLRLTIPLSRDAQASPAIRDGKIVVVQPDGVISCYNLADGTAAWGSSVTTQGNFFGVPAAIVDVAGADKIFAFPGAGDRDTTGSSTIAGYEGYRLWYGDLDTGVFNGIIPGNNSTYAAMQRGGDGNGGDGGKPGLSDLPTELVEMLQRLSDKDSMLKTIDYYGEMYGLDPDEIAKLKQIVSDHLDKLERFTESRKSGRSEGHAASLPGSSFDANWPTSESVRSGGLSYLSRGTQKYFAMRMNEIPGLSVEMRVIQFSLNPNAKGELRWMYSTDSVANASTLAAAAPLLVPNVNDPNGAYLLAPIGRNIAVFDASAGNTPIFEIEMPGFVYSSPVYANGMLVVCDTDGNVRVYCSNNEPPEAPVLSTPAEGTNILNLVSPHSTWAASTDDNTAQGNLTYVIRYSIDSDGPYDYTEIELAAGTTSYDWTDLTDDDKVTFMVRAVDEAGAASPWSEPVNFSYRLDQTAPADVTSLDVDAGALSFVVSFDASADEAPDGTADVVNYRIAVTEQGTANTFEVDIDLAHNHTINGQNPDTPLDDTKTYDITVTAFDHRGNESAGVTVSATPFDENGPDISPPEIIQATLYDNDSNGYIETVVVEFTENIAAAPDVDGFLLDGDPATGYTSLVGSTLTLTFGVGVEGTGALPLTYDSSLGDVRDLSNNAMVDVLEAADIEIDAAPPILLTSTIVAVDDDSNGHPDSLTFQFSEAIDLATVDQADIKRVTDVGGTQLVIIDVSIFSDFKTIYLSFDNQTGSMAGAFTVTIEDNNNGVFFADGAGNQLTVAGGNEAPTVSVTPATGTTISPGLMQFIASATDPDGDSDAIAFEWSINFSSSTTPLKFYPEDDSIISGVGENQASLLATEPGLYIIELNVQDEDGAVTQRLIQFTVSNEAPMACAGHDVDVLSGSTLALSASSSSDKNSSGNYQDIQDYLWEITDQPPGAGASVISNTLEEATFDTTSLPTGTYAITLTVTDSGNNSATDTITVRVHDGSNVPVVADAGPDRYVPVGEPFTLEAGFSYDDGDITYTWTQASGPVNLIDDPSSNASTTLTTSAIGVFVFTLVANDGTYMDTDTVTITTFNQEGNYVPNLIVAVPANIERNEPIEIDASASVDINTTTSPLLNVEMICGPQLFQLDGGSTLEQTYIALEAGISEFRMRVTDGTYSSPWETFRIAVTVENNDQPVLDVSAVDGMSVTIGDDPVALDFTGSADGDNDAMEFTLRQTGGPAAASLSGVNDEAATFTPSIPGVYYFELNATDGTHWAVPAEFEVWVNPANLALPQATASPDTQEINLQSSPVAIVESKDENKPNLNYLWVQVSGPTSRINDPTTARTSIDLPDENGSYVYELWVDDGNYRTSAGRVSVSTTGETNNNGGGSDNARSSGGGFCSLFATTYGIPLLALIAVLAIVTWRMVAVYRRRAPDQSI